MNNSKTMGMIKFLPALQYAFPEIKNAFYVIDEDTKEEYVHISYQYALSRDFFRVNVSCDSIPAMYNDVWKECVRRFL